jgi:hypothetical protein
VLERAKTVRALDRAAITISAKLNEHKNGTRKWSQATMVVICIQEIVGSILSRHNEFAGCGLCGILQFFQENSRT